MSSGAEALLCMKNFDSDRRIVAHKFSRFKLEMSINRGRSARGGTIANGQFICHVTLIEIRVNNKFGA